MTNHRNRRPKQPGCHPSCNSFAIDHATKLATLLISKISTSSDRVLAFPTILWWWGSLSINNMKMEASGKESQNSASLVIWKNQAAAEAPILVLEASSHFSSMKKFIEDILFTSVEMKLHLMSIARSVTKECNATPIMRGTGNLTTVNLPVTLVPNSFRKREKNSRQKESMQLGHREPGKALRRHSGRRCETSWEWGHRRCFTTKCSNIHRNRAQKVKLSRKTGKPVETHIGCSRLFH